jgi:hypothetical protein
MLYARVKRDGNLEGAVPRSRGSHLMYFQGDRPVQRAKHHAFRNHSRRTFRTGTSRSARRQAQVRGSTGWQGKGSQRWPRSWKTKPKPDRKARKPPLTEPRHEIPKPDRQARKPPLAEPRHEIYGAACATADHGSSRAGDSSHRVRAGVLPSHRRQAHATPQQYWQHA